MLPPHLGRQREGDTLRKVSYSVQRAWLWVGSLIRPVMMLKGVAFQEMILNPVITIDINHTGTRHLVVDGPTYLPGRVRGIQFTKVDTSSVESFGEGKFQGFYYYEMKHPVIFGPEDLAELRHYDGKMPVKGFPEYEVRRVQMG